MRKYFFFKIIKGEKNAGIVMDWDRNILAGYPWITFTDVCHVDPPSLIEYEETQF